MIDRGKHNVLGVLIDAVDYEGALARILAAVERREPLGVSALAVHGVMTGVLDAVHRFRLNRLELVTPDGQPVRWALKLLHGIDLPDRVYGPTLMTRVCEAAAAKRLPIFLFGGTTEMLDQLRARLTARFPELVIAGSQPSRFRRLTPAEHEEALAAIEASGAAMTFVGIGCPRQEVWTFEARKRLGHPVIAVGAAFAFHAGTLHQAPAFLADRGLEWLFRLISEPRRLWRRYLLLNPLYLTLLTMQWTRMWRADPGTALPPTEEILYG
jgi:exopolysaccharide biosynthesis WecB/TagA/CpsF family protein